MYSQKRLFVDRLKDMTNRVGSRPTSIAVLHGEIDHGGS